MSAPLLMKVRLYPPVYFCFLGMLRCSLGGEFIYLLMVFRAAQRDLHADIFSLPLRTGMCWCASFQDNKAA